MQHIYAHLIFSCNCFTHCILFHSGYVCGYQLHLLHFITHFCCMTGKINPFSTWSLSHFHAFHEEPFDFASMLFTANHGTTPWLLTVTPGTIIITSSSLTLLVTDETVCSLVNYFPSGPGIIASQKPFCSW